VPLAVALGSERRHGGSEMQARQLLTLSGLAAVVLIAFAFGVSGDSPSSSGSAASIKAFYVDHDTGQHLGAFILMIATALLILFAATLRSALVDADPGTRSLWGNVLFAGATIAAAGFLLAAVLQFTLSDSPENLSGPAAQALNALSSETWPAFTGGIGVMLIGAAGGMIPLASGLRWLGWSALVLGVVIFTPVGFVGFAGAGLWMVLASVALTMQQRGSKAGLGRPVAAS
jgi:hypothetical protein